MDFNTLRNVQTKERNNNSLQRLEKNFYDDVKEYVAMHEENYHLMRSKKVCSDDIKRMRFHKIVNKAMYDAECENTSNTTDNMTKEEEELYNKLISFFKEWFGETE